MYIRYFFLWIVFYGASSWAIPTPEEWFQAAEGGSFEDIERLLEEGADINISNEEGQTALHMAAQNGHLKIWNILLDNGANVQTVDLAGQTVFHYAVLSGQLAIVRHLLNTLGPAIIQAADFGGRTALHAAVRYGHLEIVELLLRNLPPDIIQARGRYFQRGNTAFELALIAYAYPIHPVMLGYREDQLHCVFEFLRRINNLVEEDRPLQAINLDWKLSCYQEHIRRNPEILARVCPPFPTTLQSYRDILAVFLRRAVLNGDLITLRYLQAFGCIDLLIAYGELRQGALHIAVRQNQLQVLQWLLALGANPNLRDSDGYTPLHLAVDLAADDDLNQIARELIQAGANLNLLNPDGDAPLHAALNFDLNQMAHELIQAGADLNLPDREDNTPLHLAILDRNEAIVEGLVEAGANILVRDAHGATPLELATELNFDFARELIEARIPIYIVEIGSNNCLGGIDEFFM